MLATPSLPEPVLELRDLLNTYLEPDRVAVILRAFDLGARAHDGQTRRTGEPYILHPVAVARIMATMRMDYQSVAAAVLHDTIEDTPLTLEEIQNHFGDEIADLVDGVTKLDQMKFRTRVEADAESFRKLMLAMSRDLRVIFIKLADRLHNMRTLGSMSDQSRRRIARETLEIYAPIADRLGMHSLKSELEELGFENLFPWRYRTIDQHIQTVTGNRREVIETIRKALKNKMNDAGVPCRIIGREKTPYSIYSKMLTKDLSFSEVTDVYGFRIITHSAPDCYKALGAAHALYQPRPGRFKDYIALPKANGYQSLHTVLNSPYDLPVEIQIRTEEMDVMAEKGAAAHWQYKSGESNTGSAQVRAREWLMQLVEVQRHTGDSLEFLEDVKSDLFPNEIFVFTPKGKIIDLRRNSTALDFAYAIHTDVGNHTRSVLVDKVEAPLSIRLENGQTVEILTDPDAHPQPDWLDIVATAKARTSIRHYLKSLEREDTVALGLRMLEKALNARGTSVEAIAPEQLDRFLADNHYARQEDLLKDLAHGNMLSNVVAAKLAPESGLQPGQDASSEALTIAGSEGSVVGFGACCHPVPGDRIMGYVSAGKGVVVHRVNCRNTRELRKHPDRCLDVAWAPIIKGLFPVALRVISENLPGVLANISTSISEAGSNIERVEQPEANPETATLLFTLSVQDRDHMARVMRRLRRNRNVLRVSRISA
ncbi:MAG: RelA/SpoT family protein [Xanthomonadales bacterium]|nr:RelA/SpoT family protein [Xanthomonadales bacterium]NIN58707.1 RelA/SpoT family protein [Xanthomonadales bacterium]NIN73973.1 RelA/SpoT family protein [Xanthomonadales bacterium]NIO12888.1 RelA/SpoT family protein [Xanthomonadales bacterium]NIP11100.1 RelA/SpoT family protein [Xanthomonadales bacterium]